MKSKPTLLLHPVFITCVLLLILNDFYLKYEYHNWITGKLSDFTGLFSFTIFLFALFPKIRRKAIILFISLFFIWWKSPVSNFLISFLNSSLQIPVHRVIDYTDLFALVVLYFIFFIKPIAIQRNLVKKVATGSIGVISLIAFTATSLPRRLADNNKVLLDEYIKTNKTEGEIIKRLEENGLKPQKKDKLFIKMWAFNYYLKPKDSDTIMIPLDSLYDGAYREIGYGSAYVIPKIYVANDSLSNLEFIISKTDRGKTDISLYAFQGQNSNSDRFAYYSGYWEWKKFKKPLKRKFKAMLKD